MAAAGIRDGPFVRDDLDAGNTVSRSFRALSAPTSSAHRAVCTRSSSPTKRKAIIVWVLRAIALVLVILGFVLTIKNFCGYFPFSHQSPPALHAHRIGIVDTDDPNAACQWCKYLSCIPTKSNDHCSGTVSCLPNIDS